MTLTAILLLAAGTFAFRLAGPLLRNRFTVSEAVAQRLSLAAIALLAALVAVATVLPGGHFRGFALPAGVACGALLAWRRLPFVAVIIAAAGTTALLRLAGVA
jgi:branched-subunit amino acid transport protein